MEVGVTEVFFLFLQPRGKSFTAWAASHFAFKHARPGEPLRHPVTGAGRRPDGTWPCCPMASGGEAAGAASSRTSRVAAPSGSPVVQVALHALRRRSFQPEVRSQASGSLPSTKWRTRGCSTFILVAPRCHGRSVALEVQMLERVLSTLAPVDRTLPLAGRHAGPRTSPANSRTLS